MAEPTGTGADRANDADTQSRPDDLTVVAFATAHLVSVALLAVLASHLGGSIGDVLGALDTRIGVGLFALAWAVVAVAHRFGFAHADPWSVVAGDGDTLLGVGRFVLAGTAWGAVAGGAFALVAFVGFLLISTLLDPTRLADLLTLVTAYLLLIAAGIGLAVGGVIGLAAATGDAVVLTLVNRIASTE